MKNKGFSLIELIIICMIIGILIIMAVGMVSNYQLRESCNKGNRQACHQYDVNRASTVIVTPAPEPILSPVTVVNDQEIVYQNHLYKRVD